MTRRNDVVRPLRIDCLKRSIELEFPFCLSDFKSPCRPNSLCRQGLSLFWSTVFPAAPGGDSFTSGGSATAEDIIFSLDSADTFPSATTSPSQSVALCTHYPAGDGSIAILSIIP